MKELRIVCSNPPSNEHGEFIEIEDENGKSVSVGEWSRREDGLWEYIIDVDTLR